MDTRTMRVYVKSEGHKYHKYLKGDSQAEGPLALDELRKVHPDYTEAGLEMLDDQCEWDCVVKFPSGKEDSTA